MSILRDLLAILGSVGCGWFLWNLNHHTERATSQGITFGLVCLAITIYSIRADQKAKEELKRKLDKIHTRNLYLEAAIKQGGEE